jgi:hypothetical protein
MVKISDIKTKCAYNFIINLKTTDTNFKKVRDIMCLENYLINVRKNKEGNFYINKKKYNKFRMERLFDYLYELRKKYPDLFNSIKKELKIKLRIPSLNEWKKIKMRKEKATEKRTDKILKKIDQEEAKLKKEWVTMKKNDNR